jgi:hypothetical protein
MAETAATDPIASLSRSFPRHFCRSASSGRPGRQARSLRIGLPLYIFRISKSNQAWPLSNKGGSERCASPQGAGPADGTSRVKALSSLKSRDDRGSKWSDDSVRLLEPPDRCGGGGSRTESGWVRIRDPLSNAGWISADSVVSVGADAMGGNEQQASAEVETTRLPLSRKVRGNSARRSSQTTPSSRSCGVRTAAIFLPLDRSGSPSLNSRVNSQPRRRRSSIAISAKCHEQTWALSKSSARFCLVMCRMNLAGIGWEIALARVPASSKVWVSLLRTSELVESGRRLQTSLTSATWAWCRAAKSLQQIGIAGMLQPGNSSSSSDHCDEANRHRASGALLSLSK